MSEILNMSVNEMPQTKFVCECGREHYFDVKALAIGKGALAELPRIVEPFKNGKILVVFDSNTYKVAGERACALLRENGFNIKELLFDCGDDILIPDEKTLGRIIQECDLDVTLMIAVGSGVINDSVKFVTSRCRLPYVVVATAPSMDGYVSDGAPIISGGYKYSPVAHLTYGLVGDTDVLATAPQDLIAAGYGDVVGKLTALADWELSVKVNGEYRCEVCATLTSRALDKCFSTAAGLKTHDGEAINALFEALTITGVAMALINTSRPASGAEHLLSHYWEMDYIARGLNPIHHGIQVGVATVAIARVFELLSDVLPEGVAELCPSHERIVELLRLGGAPASPCEIGIDKELFYQSLVNSDSVRPRYSVLKFAKDKGLIESIAKQITDEFYA